MKTSKTTRDVPDLSQTAGWYCVRTLPKHEHITAACLRQELNLEIFLPRIRYERRTRRGLAWTTEALFANYVFARFELSTSLRRVQAARGVRNVVHFGSSWPAVPASVIAELQEVIGQEELHVIRNMLRPGDRVEIADGPFHGLLAVVKRVMPSRERVAVLLDFLGRQTDVELANNRLILVGQGHPVEIFAKHLNSAGDAVPVGSVQ